MKTKNLFSTNLIATVSRRMSHMIIMQVYFCLQTVKQFPWSYIAILARVYNIAHLVHLVSKAAYWTINLCLTADVVSSAATLYIWSFSFPMRLPILVMLISKEIFLELHIIHCTNDKQKAFVHSNFFALTSQWMEG